MIPIIVLTYDRNAWSIGPFAYLLNKYVKHNAVYVSGLSKPFASEHVAGYEFIPGSYNKHE